MSAQTDALRRVQYEARVDPINKQALGYWIESQTLPEPERSEAARKFALRASEACAEKAAIREEIPA